MRSDKRNENSEFEFIDGISYTEYLLVIGQLTLIEIFKQIREKNERLSFDLVVAVFCKICNYMADIDEIFNEIFIDENYDNIFEKNYMDIYNNIIFYINSIFFS